MSELKQLEQRIARLERISSKKAGLIGILKLHSSTGIEMVSMIESKYDEYGLDENYIEIESIKESRSTGDTYKLVSLEGYYGIVRDDGRREDVETVSDNFSKIKRIFDNK